MASITTCKESPTIWFFQFLGYWLGWHPISLELDPNPNIGRSNGSIIYPASSAPKSYNKSYGDIALSAVILLLWSTDIVSNWAINCNEWGRIVFCKISNEWSI